MYVLTTPLPPFLPPSLLQTEKISWFSNKYLASTFDINLIETRKFQSASTCNLPPLILGTFIYILFICSFILVGVSE